MKDFKEYKEIFEHYMVENFPKVSPRELYEPYKYLMELDAKRIRPVMMLAANECYTKQTNEVLITALAVELFHNFSLMHDDIMDKSDTRRGKPTVHKKFNENSAILSGDVMLILSYELLAKLKDTPYFHDIFHLYNQTAIQICTGQQLDMNFEKEYIVTEMEYLLMIEYKTAVLLATSIQIGAILGGASNEEQKLMYSFGKNIGLAFQIQDDLLDSFGDSINTGKKVGGDILNNKKTLLLIKALQSPNRYHKELLNNWLQTFENSDHKIEDFKRIYEESGAMSYTIKKRDYFYNLALEDLAKTSISKENKEKLINFAKKSVDRIK